MQQFIPLEDDWDVLDQLDPSVLIPYRVGLVASHDAVPAARQCTGPISPPTVNASPTRAPMRRAVPADSSST